MHTRTQLSQAASPMKIRALAVTMAAVLTLLFWSTALAVAPTVTGVSPNNGPTTGGTSVVISGTNFTGATAVTFGGTAASFSVQSPTLIAATAPARAAGQIDVVVTADGPSATSVNSKFTYNAVIPVVSSISPTSGATGGGTTVTLFGSGFLGAQSVSFGATGANFTTPVNDTQMTATAPPGVGVVNVRVTSSAGTSLIGVGNQYTYTGTGPTITSLTPSSGSTSGGNQVIISGSNFTGATQVTFGGTFASFVVNSVNQITATAPAHVAGTFDVTVTTPNGTNLNTTADNYTYTGVGAIPIISSLTPSFGPTTGGTSVVLTGSGFLGVFSVSFGGVGASFSTPVNDFQMVVTAPPHVAGTFDVFATNGSGTNLNTTGDNFTYVGSGAPIITSIFPSSGPTTGGTQVTITGSGFTGAQVVSFGGTAATFTVFNNNQIVATAPARFASTVYIVVTTSLGSSLPVNAALFTYGVSGQGPIVSSVSPSSGPVVGGTAVTIFGSGFTSANSVSFGGYSASFFVVSDSQISATSPARFAGTVYIIVTTALGSSSATSGALFTYGTSTGVPVITNVSPAGGPTSGGTAVTVTGYGFLNAQSLSFGGTFPSSFFIISDNTITVTSPAHVAGTVVVIVTNAFGSSTSTTGSQFTYGLTTPILTSLSPTSGPVGTVVTMTGLGLTGVTSVRFGGVLGNNLVFVSDSSIRVTVPSLSIGTFDVVITTTGGTSVVTISSRFTVTTTNTGVTSTYSLTFRWSLIVWKGVEGANIGAALRGQETPDNTATNNVFNSVTAIFRWAGTTQTWLGYFPAGEGVPGANDFTTFSRETAYWIAATSSISWTILTGQ